MQLSAKQKLTHYEYGRRFNTRKICKSIGEHKIKKQNGEFGKKSAKMPAIFSGVNSTRL